MLIQLRTAIVTLLLLTLLTGVAYPIAVTGIAKLAFASRANGSLVVRNGRVVGSHLIGQSFDDPKYFWGRISATSPMPYNASASSGSNLGPSNSALVDPSKARVDALRAADPTNRAPIPIDLVTASASGLDPHISPSAAHYQVPRVARIRGLDEARLQALVDALTEPPDFVLIGEPRVNVLELNLALDGLK